jgi:hypothetical protein
MNRVNEPFDFPFNSGWRALLELLGLPAIRTSEEIRQDSDEEETRQKKDRD